MAEVLTSGGGDEFFTREEAKQMELYAKGMKDERGPYTGERDLRLAVFGQNLIDNTYGPDGQSHKVTGLNMN